VARLGTDDRRLCAAVASSARELGG
jgi:hypothetical protein